MISTKFYLSKLVAMLTSKATKRLTTTYKEIGEWLNLPVSSGRHQAVGISTLLDIISQWYLNRGTLDLTSLVVRNSGEHAGTPGNGFWIRRGLRHTSEQERAILTARYHEEIFLAYEKFVVTKVADGLNGHDEAFERAMVQVDQRKAKRLELFKSTIEPLFLDFARRYCPDIPDIEIRQRINYAVNPVYNQNRAMLLFADQFVLTVRDAESETRFIEEIKNTKQHERDLRVGFCGFDRNKPPFDHDLATQCWLDTMSSFGFMVSARAQPNAYAIRNEGIALDCTMHPRAPGVVFYIAKVGATATA